MIISPLLLGAGIGITVFKTLEDLNILWSWLVSFLLLYGIISFVQGSQEKTKKEILNELNK